MNRRPGPLNFALHKKTEFGPKAANPPRSCRNAAGRLRHRRLWLPCPSLKLLPVGLLRNNLASAPIAPLATHVAGRGRLR